MPISSLIVRIKKEKSEEIARTINSLKEADVFEIHGDNMIVLMETKESLEDKALWDEIEKIPGVIQCDLIYHNFEDSGSDSN